MHAIIISFISYSFADLYVYMAVATTIQLPEVYATRTYGREYTYHLIFSLPLPPLPRADLMLSSSRPGEQLSEYQYVRQRQ